MKLKEKTLPKELKLDKNFEHIVNLCVWSAFCLFLFVGTIITCNSHTVSLIFLIVPFITFYLLFFDREQKSLKLLSKGIKTYNGGNIKKGLKYIEQSQFVSPKNGYYIKTWLERSI